MHELKRNTKRRTSKTIARGGKRGKTSGHGHKGQKQHGRHGIRPEMRDMIKRIPKLRGRGKNSNKSIQEKPLIINLSVIENNFKNGETVSPITIKEKGILTFNQFPKGGIKILANGELSKKIKVSACLVSDSARAKIEKIGGEIN